MKKIVSIYRRCKKAESKFLISVCKYMVYKWFYGKKIFTHHKVSINDIRNIETNHNLEIGMNYVGFIDKNDKTLLNIKGKLKLAGNYSIGRGCRFDISENAVLSIGKGGYINVNSTFIIMHGLIIGDDCAISWDCQFLDEDFHTIDYQGKEEKEKEIKIGNNVWIGCGAKIYQGSVIPDGSVIASNSIVRGVFLEKNTLIAGHPARVIKHEVVWK